MFLSFNVQRLQGRNIEYSGLAVPVGETPPGNYQVRLSGVASGITVLPESGYFHGYSTTVGFGQIVAQIFDINGAPASKTRQYDYQNLAPTLSYQVQQSGPAQFQITGTVADEDPQLSTVVIGGAGSGSATPSTSGGFSFTFNSSTLGNVQAQAFDSLGLTSSVISLPLVNAAPVITSFSGYRQGSFWVLEGTVSDEVPAGLIVTFASSIPMIDGATAVVSSNGTFTRSFPFKQGQYGGVVSAQTVDWFGVPSNTMYTLVG